MAYKLALRVETHEQAMTILQAIAGNAQLIYLVPEKAEEPKHIQLNGVNRPPGKRPSVESLIINVLKNNGGETSVHAFIPAFVEAGFSPVSVSPALSKMTRDGKIVRTQRGTWLVPK